MVESTRASTGEMPHAPHQHKHQDGKTNDTSSIVPGDGAVPSIQVVDSSPPTSSSSSCTSLVEDESTSYLQGSVVDEGNPQLAGIGAFSPAPSQPPSPTISRVNLNGARFTLQPFTDLSGKVGRVRSNSDISGSKSLSEEEVSGVQMRRRVRDGGGRTDD